MTLQYQRQFPELRGYVNQQFFDWPCENYGGLFNYGKDPAGRSGRVGCLRFASAKRLQSAKFTRVKTGLRCDPAMFALNVSPRDLTGFRHSRDLHPPSKARHAPAWTATFSELPTSAPSHGSWPRMRSFDAECKSLIQDCQSGSRAVESAKAVIFEGSPDSL
jgi:hypothetical protein